MLYLVYYNYKIKNVIHQKPLYCALKRVTGLAGAGKEVTK